MDSITIRLDVALSQKLEQSLKPYYSTKTEFIREAIRDKLKQIETERIVSKLSQLKGSAHTTPTELTQSEYELLVAKLSAKTTSQKLREYDLEGIPIVGKISNISRD